MAFHIFKKRRSQNSCFFAAVCPREQRHIRCSFIWRISVTFLTTSVPKTVLIVDGNPYLRALLASVLQREGFQSLEASTGVEAIKKAIAKKSDVSCWILNRPIWKAQRWRGF
jgi:PleD family two-component response regulator